MDDLKLDAESVSRNKNYGVMDHLIHLLKIGWDKDSPLIKKFLRENSLSESDIDRFKEQFQIN